MLLQILEVGELWQEGVSKYKVTIEEEIEVTLTYEVYIDADDREAAADLAEGLLDGDKLTPSKPPCLSPERDVYRERDIWVEPIDDITVAPNRLM